MSGIHPQDLLQVQDAAEQTVLIDVRSAAEFESVRIPGSHSLPLDLLQQRPDAVAANLPAGSVLLCQSGVRSQQALTAVSAAGGATRRCSSEASMRMRTPGKLLRGRSTWSMERQVRMAAGSLVAAWRAGRSPHPSEAHMAFVRGGLRPHLRRRIEHLRHGIRAQPHAVEQSREGAHPRLRPREHRRDAALDSLNRSALTAAHRERRRDGFEEDTRGRMLPRRARGIIVLPTAVPQSPEDHRCAAQTQRPSARSSTGLSAPEVSSTR